jgi:hypothetical protein
MTVLAIDPGPEQSAWVLWDGEEVMGHAKADNGTIRSDFQSGNMLMLGYSNVVFEQVASYGMAVGADVFETCVWTGRLWEVAAGSGHPVSRLPRKDVKLHLCGQTRAKDSNIRQALLDRFGGKEKAIGRKKAPGPLYGLKADEWQALALAVTFYDQHVLKATA